MRPTDEYSWEHAVRSDHSHQPVWSEPKREWCTHSVPAQPVLVSVWLCAEQHDCVSEHGEDWWATSQPAGVRQQPHSFILTSIQVHGFVFCFLLMLSGIHVKCGQDLYSLLVSTWSKRFRIGPASWSLRQIQQYVLITKYISVQLIHYRNHSVRAVKVKILKFYWSH